MLTRKLASVLLFCSLFLSPVYSQINLEYWMDKGREKVQKGQFLEAINDFNTVIKFKPDYVDAFYLRGIGKYYLGDYRGAVEDYSTAISVKPYSSNLYTYFFLYRGMAREKLLDFKGAVEDFSAAIEVNPGNWNAFINRGFVYIIFKRYKDALADFDHVVLYDRENIYALLYRAVAYHELGEPRKSMDDFNKVIRLDPKNPEVWLRRGTARSENKDFKGAIDDYSRTIRIDSTTTIAWFNRALARLETLDYNGAMVDFNKVIDIDPKNDLALYHRANLKSRVSEFKGAIDDYSRVLQINPENVFTYFNRAISWQKLGNHRKAIEDYTSAIQLYPYFASAYFNRSIAKQNLNDWAGASRDYAMAEKLNASVDELKKSGKIDSTGLASLGDFKASFGADKSSINESSFDLVPNYTIGYLPNDTVAEIFSAFKIEVNPNLYPKIVELNKASLKGSFYLGYKSRKISHDSTETAYEILNSYTSKMDSAVKLFAGAILRKEMQDFNGSLENYTTIIRKRPGFGLAYFNRANTRYEALSLLRSVKEYSKPVTIGQPSVSSGISDRAVIMPAHKDVIADYKKCIEIDPRFFYAYFNLANILTAQKDFTGAIIHYSKVLQLEPGLGEAYYNRGLVHLYIHEKESGCSDLSKAGEFGVQKAYDAIKTFCNK